jgi:hypothetical protein
MGFSSRPAPDTGRARKYRYQPGLISPAALRNRI